jgi:hypothetical protein
VASTTNINFSWKAIAVRAGFCFVLFDCVGCRLFDSDVVVADLGSRNENKASAPSRHHNNKGIRYLNHGKLAKAETHFRKASDSDPTSAAAHNNLGTMHLGRRDLYSAAWEFQRANDLAPRSVEPLVNLGLVFDEAERLDEAADKYMQALAIDPNHAIALGNLARVRVKQDADPLEINSLLKQVVFIDTRVEWVEWAQVLLTTKYRLEGVTTFEAPMPSSVEELPMPSSAPPLEQNGDLPLPPMPVTTIPSSANPMMMMTPVVPSPQQNYEGEPQPFSDVSVRPFVGPSQPTATQVGTVQIAPNSPFLVNPTMQDLNPNSSPVLWAIPPTPQGAP